MDEVGLLFSNGSITGVDDNFGELGNMVQAIYPNPTAGQLLVKHSFGNLQPLMVRVLDVQGRQVDAVQFDKNELPASQFSMNVGAYAPGTYFLNFVVEGKNLGSVKFEKG